MGMLKIDFRESKSMNSDINYVFEFTWTDTMLNYDRFIEAVRYIVIYSLSSILEAEWFNQSPNVFCKSFSLNNNEKCFRRYKLRFLFL